MSIFNKSWSLKLLKPSGPVQGLIYLYLYLYLYKFNLILYDAIMLMRGLSTPVLNTDIVPCSQQFIQACSLYFAANTSPAQLTPLSAADGISKNCTIALNLASQTHSIYHAWPTFSTTKQGNMFVSVNVPHQIVLEIRSRIHLTSVLYTFILGHN